MHTCTGARTEQVSSRDRLTFEINVFQITAGMLSIHVDFDVYLRLPGMFWNSALNSPWLHSTLYLLHIHAPVALYEINTDRCTHVLVDHLFINTICNYIMFQPLKGRLQGVQLIHSSKTVNTLSHQMQNLT
jgi:hypothetical protein